MLHISSLRACFTSLQCVCCVASRKNPPVLLRELQRGFDWTETLTQAMWESLEKSVSDETLINHFVENVKEKFSKKTKWSNKPS